jgi:hypothetical protein
MGCTPICAPAGPIYTQNIQIKELAKHYNEQLLNMDQIQNSELSFRVNLSHVKGKSLSEKNTFLEFKLGKTFSGKSEIVKNNMKGEYYKNYIQLFKEGAISQQDFYNFCDIISGQAEPIFAVSLSRFYVISNYTIELKTVSKTTAGMSKSTGNSKQFLEIISLLTYGHL